MFHKRLCRVCLSLAALLTAGDPGSSSEKAKSVTDYFAVESKADRDALPEFVVVPAAPESELTPALNWPTLTDHTQWHRSHGDSSSSRYSALSEINKSNVKQLAVAWVYHSQDGAGNIQCNPIVVDGIVYGPTVGGYVVAIDAETGKEIWRFHAGDVPALRGLVYWPGDARHQARLFFTTREDLWALDVKTGQPVADFGDGGRIPAGGPVAPAYYQSVLVVPLWNVVKGFDIRTGRTLWTFHLVPREGEFGHDTWDQLDGGANCWGGMSLDQARGIAYVSTGSPHPNFLGVRHRGRNLFSNSVVALEATTGKRLWHFQEIRHDIWDLDLPAPPNLASIRRNGQSYDVVAQVTKIGNTLVLDRRTGKPLFPFRLRRAPTSKLPGEQTWPYQPDLQTPEPFSRQEFTPADVTNISKQSRAAVMKQIAGAGMGWFRPFEEDRPNVYFGVHGGAEWTGAAFDPTTNLLYVSSNHVPWIMKLSKADPNGVPDAEANTPGAIQYRQHCRMCHGEELEGQGSAPSLRFLDRRMSQDEVEVILRNGTGLMPPFPTLFSQETKNIVDFLYGKERTLRQPELAGRPTYFFHGFRRLLDHEGYPGSKPPWGTLSAIDLNTGNIRWRVPLGEHPELRARGIRRTGTENFGGPTVTAGGLVFCAGTSDRKIRAFDAKTGEELWEHDLPFGGYAPPAIYEVRGREYVVVAATGGGKLGGELGDAYIAFALPRAPADEPGRE